MEYVFISYSSKNKSVADGVCHYLEENGIRCWIAPRDIPVGRDYADLIDEAICNCTAAVLVFSTSASVSQWVKGEINLAFTKGKPILPFRIDDVQINGAFRLMLNQTHWIDAFPQYADRLPDLLSSLQGLLLAELQGNRSQREPASRTSPNAGTHPTNTTGSKAEAGNGYAGVSTEPLGKKRGWEETKRNPYHEEPSASSGKKDDRLKNQRLRREREEKERMILKKEKKEARIGRVYLIIDKIYDWILSRWVVIIVFGIPSIATLLWIILAHFFEIELSMWVFALWLLPGLWGIASLFCEIVGVIIETILEKNK